MAGNGNYNAEELQLGCGIDLRKSQDMAFDAYSIIGAHNGKA